MPLKLIPPRQGWSPFWRVRGSYLGVYIDRSTKASKRGQAAKMLAKWQREIELGEFAQAGDPTFASAALDYMRAGGERLYLRPILEHFREQPLCTIRQAEIDAAAEAICPGRSAATRNRHVYTPISAVLRHAGVALPLRRPKGSAGSKTTGWLWPEEAQALFAEAGQLDCEFAALLILLCYTGMRLGEALSLGVDDVRLEDAFAYLPDTKNNEPRAVFLPPIVIAALQGHPRGLARPGERVFKFHKGGHIYSLLAASAARAGVTLPDRQSFHLFRHTYATWMRRFGGLDTKGLVGTGAWKDRKSADRYEHVVVSEEARRAVLLPGANGVQKIIQGRKD
jgi:integrase